MIYLLAILAVWRLTFMLQFDNGPGNIFLIFRQQFVNDTGDVYAEPKNGFGKMLSCFNCLSVWVALPFAIALCHSFADFLLIVLALSGGAMILEKTYVRLG